MSFDTFLQRFTDGLPVEADAASIRALLEPVVVATDGGWAELETSDGGADIYGYDNLASGFMINHAVGDAVWDLLMAVAAAGQLAIMPVGCPTCVSDASMLADLPAELATEAAVVTSGSGLVGLIRTS